MGHHSFVKVKAMKIQLCVLLVAASAILLATVEASCPAVQLSRPWPNGRKGMLKFQAPVTFKKGWEVALEFDSPVLRIQPFQGMNGKCNGTTCTFTDQNWNKFAWRFQRMSLGFGIDFDEKSTPPFPEVVSATIADKSNPDLKYILCASATTTAGTTNATETTTAAAETTTAAAEPSESDTWWEKFKKWLGFGDEEE